MRLWGGIFDYDGKIDFIQEEELKTTAAGFWDDPKEAERILKSIKSQKFWTDDYDACATQLGDLETLYEFYLAGEVSDKEVEAEYQLMVPDEAVAPKATVPVPQRQFGVVPVIVGMELTIVEIPKLVAGLPVAQRAVFDVTKEITSPVA